MNIETSSLLGGLLCGAALGIGAGVALAMREIRRRIEREPPRVCVRLARLCLGDLRGTNQDEVIALFRAKSALFELSRMMAAERNPGLRGATAAAQAPALQTFSNNEME